MNTLDPGQIAEIITSIATLGALVFVALKLSLERKKLEAEAASATMGARLSMTITSKRLTERAILKKGSKWYRAR